MVETLSTKDLAKRWSLNPSTLAKWRMSGTGPAYLKIGKAVRYKISDVEYWEQQKIR